MPKSIHAYADKEKALIYRTRQRKQNYDESKKFADRSHKQYTVEECEMILEHSITDFELGKIIHRSVEAIQGKRCKLLKCKKQDMG